MAESSVEMQGGPMHPELYQVIYRQQEREREVLLRRRLAVAERDGTMPARSSRAGWARRG